MLTIICGEDTTASRKYYIQLLEEFSQKAYFIDKIQPNQIEEVTKSAGNDGMLFNDKKMYAVQNLTSFTARKKSKDFESVLKTLIDSKSVEVLDWEEKSAREIKLKATQIKEFKASKNIFQLQEACYPKNLQNYIKLLRSVSEDQEEGFIFTMLSRHIRTLLLAKSNQLPSTVPPWMRGKFQSQADKWSLEALTGLYESLAKLDTSIKTSSNLYGIKGSLELLACYYMA
jgi:hypothetical protein